jgi:hypothetical protein
VSRHAGISQVCDTRPTRQRRARSRSGHRRSSHRASSASQAAQERSAPHPLRRLCLLAILCAAQPGGVMSRRLHRVTTVPTASGSPSRVRPTSPHERPAGGGRRVDERRQGRCRSRGPSTCSPTGTGVGKIGCPRSATRMRHRSFQWPWPRNRALRRRCPGTLTAGGRWLRLTIAILRESAPSHTPSSAG